MKHRTIYFRVLATVLCAAIVFQAASCGTLIHPERRGQESGKIDPAIAILDGIGLLLFVVPGLVAYAIDFSTGAIYLPPGEASFVPNGAGPNGFAAEDRVVHMSPDAMDARAIEGVLARETGFDVSFDDPRMEAYRFDHRNTMLRVMANENARIATGDRMAQARPTE